MAVTQGSWQWHARPGVVTTRLIYAGLMLLGVTVGLILVALVSHWYRSTRPAVPVLFATFTGAPVLGWLGGRFLLGFLEKAGRFGSVRIAAGHLSLGFTSFDLTQPFNADARSHGEHVTYDIAGINRMRPYRTTKSAPVWVWNGCVQVEQGGQWLTLTADTRESQRQAKRRERSDKEDAWQGIEMRSNAPSPPRGKTLRLRPDDLAAVIRTLQTSPHYTDIDTDGPSFGTPPKQMSVTLKTAIGVTALAALAAGTVFAVSNHVDRLSSQRYRQEHQDKEDTTAKLEAHWQTQVGRHVRVDVRDATVFGRIVQFKIGTDDAVDLTVVLVYVDDGTSSREPQVRINGRDAGKGDEVYVSPQSITFVEPSVIPEPKPTLGGLSPEGTIEFKRILGDRLGQPLTEEEQEKVLDEFRKWVMADPGPDRVRDLVAAQALLAD